MSSTDREGEGRRVLMVGLDAAEPRLIEEGIAEGWLPNLRELRERGAYGRLASSAEWLAGSPWPTFYTGTGPAEHGLYHWQQWRPERMGLFRCDPEWLPLEPFWRAWGPDDPRLIAFDVPMTYAPTPFNGMEIAGWASHDHLVPPASHPADLMGRIVAEFGEAPMSDEVYAPQPAADVLALRDEYIATTDAVAEAAARLAAREEWDVFLVAFGATHRAGHKLWSHRGLSEPVSDEEGAAFPAALRDVYVAADRAVGHLVETVGDGPAVLAFSLHGMGPNVSRAELVGRMLDRIFAPETEPEGGTVRRTLLQRIRERIPEGYRDLVKDRLPRRWQEDLGRYWRRTQVNWQVTRAFAPDADLQGYVRLNVRGRERDGIVEPGEEYESLLRRIEEGLRGFVDADTEEPVAREVARAERLFPDGARRGGLPDLLVRWAESPAAAHRALHSARHGPIPWPLAGSHPTGRSGNHRGEGFLVGCGPGFAPGGTVTGGHILDLAPTLHSLLGVSTPSGMRGRRLSSG